MSNAQIEPRLGRLFGADGRCAVGMFDHGLFGEPSWTSNHAQVAELVRRSPESGLDAISLPAGMGATLQALPGPKPTLIMRGDFCDFWRRGSHPFVSIPLRGTIDDALRLDAACVITTLIQSTSNPQLLAACLRTVDAVRSACQPYGLPVMIEAVAFDDSDGAFTSVDDLETVATLARLGFELGADVVKVEPSAEASEFGEVVAAAGGAPVLAGSGATVDDDGVRRRTAELIAAGAAGVGYGGNFLRAEDVHSMTREVAEIVHADSGSAPAKA